MARKHQPISEQRVMTRDGRIGFANPCYEGDLTVDVGINGRMETFYVDEVTVCEDSDAYADAA